MTDTTETPEYMRCLVTTIMERDGPLDLLDPLKIDDFCSAWSALRKRLKEYSGVPLTDKVKDEILEHGRAVQCRLEKLKANRHDGNRNKY